jgi:16S rRNA (adenine1518-N6/adenine1519-N6)-dimethyltransferase
MPRKRFGQHFLERAWVEKLIDVVRPERDDTFLEIGPGRGALTIPIARAAARVVAIEIDRDLVRHLRAHSLPNVTLIEQDVLEVTADRLAEALRQAGLTHPSRAPFRVAGNLPYNVASPILFKLIEWYRAGLCVGDATLMLQKEVADRLVARPASREYGVLAILVRHTADAERLLVLPPGAFRPVPKVSSALVRLRLRPETPRAGDRLAFEALVRAVFTRRRKTLAKALLAYRPGDPEAIREALDGARIDGRRRPESLDIDEFVRLSDAFGQPRRTPAAGRRSAVL